MSDYATAARLLYPLLAVDEFARLCATCRALQALARSHETFQAAAVGWRILNLTQHLDHQRREYTEPLPNKQLSVRLQSHCLELLMQNRGNRPWRGRDLELVAIYDAALRCARWVREPRVRGGYDRLQGRRAAHRTTSHPAGPRQGHAHLGAPRLGQ